jgi:tetratricopeptide (TPR) repeat protein
VAEVLIELGHEYASDGAYEEALDTFRRAAALDPARGLVPEVETAAALVELGRELASDGAYEEALDTFHQAIELDPTLALVPEAEVALMQGREHARRGETDAALTALERAVELDQTLDLDPVAEVTRVLIEEGRAYAERGAYDKAEEYLSQAVALDPTVALVPEAEVAVAQARRHARQSQVDEALDALERAITLDPQLKINRAVDLAQIYDEACWRGNLGGPDESALRACERAVALAIKTDDGYLNLRVCRNKGTEGLANVVLPACERAAALAVEISFGETVTGTLEAGGHDIYMFEGTAGQVISIEMNQHDSMLNPYLLLWGPDGAMLTRDNDSGGDRDALIDHFFLAETGTYSIVALGFRDASAGAYTLTLIHATVQR